MDGSTPRLPLTPPDAPPEQLSFVDPTGRKGVRAPTLPPDIPEYEEPPLVQTVRASHALVASRLLLVAWAVVTVVVTSVLRSRSHGEDTSTGPIGVLVAGWLLISVLSAAAGWWWSDRNAYNVHQLGRRLPGRARCVSGWAAPVVWSLLLAVTVVRFEPTEVLDVRPTIIVAVFVAAMWRPYSLCRRLIRSLSRVDSDGLVGTAFLFDLAAFGFMWWQFERWPSDLGPSTSGSADLLVGLAAAACVAYAVNAVLWLGIARSVRTAMWHRRIAARTLHDHRHLRLRGIDPMDPVVRWALLRVRQEELAAAQARVAPTHDVDFAPPPLPGPDEAARRRREDSTPVGDVDLRESDGVRYGDDAEAALDQVVEPDVADGRDVTDVPVESAVEGLVEADVPVESVVEAEEREPGARTIEDSETVEPGDVEALRTDESDRLESIDDPTQPPAPDLESDVEADAESVPVGETLPSDQRTIDLAERLRAFSDPVPIETDADGKTGAISDGEPEEPEDDQDSVDAVPVVPPSDRRGPDLSRLGVGNESTGTRVDATGRQRGAPDLTGLVGGDDAGTRPSPLERIAAAAADSSSEREPAGLGAALRRLGGGADAGPGDSARRSDRLASRFAADPIAAEHARLDRLAERLGGDEDVSRRGNLMGRLAEMGISPSPEPISEAVTDDSSDLAEPVIRRMLLLEMVRYLVLVALSGCAVGMAWLVVRAASLDAGAGSDGIAESLANPRRVVFAALGLAIALVPAWALVVVASARRCGVEPGRWVGRLIAVQVLAALLGVTAIALDPQDNVAPLAALFAGTVLMAVAVTAVRNVDYQMGAPTQRYTIWTVLMFNAPVLLWASGAAGAPGTRDAPGAVLFVVAVLAMALGAGVVLFALASGATELHIRLSREIDDSDIDRPPRADSGARANDQPDRADAAARSSAAVRSSESSDDEPVRPD